MKRFPSKRKRPLSRTAPTLGRSRRSFALGVLAITAIALIAVPGATAVSGEPAAGGLRVIFSERGHILPFPTAGTFVLSGTAGSDSGTTRVTPGEGPGGIRDGQRFVTVSGTDFLTGKKGNLVIQFTGISVNAGANVFVEYGTWRIYRGLGTGMYKNWRGGGRWAATSTQQGSSERYSVRWEGLVSR